MKEKAYLKSLMAAEEISILIHSIRGQRVMLDRDLAELYGVSVKVLNQAVKRRKNRFPVDFMFQLSREESRALRSQIVTLEAKGRGQYSKYFPHVFTEQGVAMLSSVLNSERAAQVNIAIMRAFVKIRGVLATHKNLAKRLEAAESGLADHGVKLGEHAAQIESVFEAIRQLMEPPEKPRRRIGFVHE